MRRILLSFFALALLSSAVHAQQWLKQLTPATIVIGPFVDSVDGVTPKGSLTISQADVRLSKNGQPFAQTNNSAGATAMENGYYSVPLDTTDTNTLGRLRVAVNESSALPVWQDFMVVPGNVHDSLVGQHATDKLEIDVAQVAGQTATVATTPLDANVTRFGGTSGMFSSGRPEVNTTHLNGSSQSLLDLKDFADNGYDPSGDLTRSNLRAIYDDTNAPYGAARFFSGYGWGPMVWRSVVSTVDSQTELRVVGTGPGVNQSVTGCTVIVRDDQVLNQMMVAEVTDYSATSETVKIEPVGGTFTIGVGDILEFLPPAFNGDDRTDLVAVKGKTDFLPSATAGTNGGLATLDTNLNVQADIEAIDDDTGAPANAERFFDGEGYGPLVTRTTVASVVSQTQIRLTGITGGAEDALLGAVFVIRDHTWSGLSRYVRYAHVTDYDEDDDLFTIVHDGGSPFTIASGNIVDVLPP